MLGGVANFIGPDKLQLNCKIHHPQYVLLKASLQERI